MSTRDAAGVPASWSYARGVNGDAVDDLEDVEQVARPRVAAGALFFDESGRVLLLQPSYKPGGRFLAGMYALARRLIRGRFARLRRSLGLLRRLGRCWQLIGRRIRTSATRCCSCSMVGCSASNMSSESGLIMAKFLVTRFGRWRSLKRY